MPLPIHPERKDPRARYLVPTSMRRQTSRAIKPALGAWITTDNPQLHSPGNKRSFQKSPAQMKFLLVLLTIFGLFVLCAIACE